jgi:transcriptional regulator GlxA family with amidase domain
MLKTVARTPEKGSPMLGDCPAIAEKVIGFVLENFAERISLEDLAKQVGLTRYNFCRRFQKECGITPMRWLWSFRTMLAKELIVLDPTWSLTDVAFACGFTSSAHFSRTYKQMFGERPSEFRRRAQADYKLARTPFPRSYVRPLGSEDRSLMRKTALAAIVNG